MKKIILIAILSVFLCSPSFGMGMSHKSHISNSAKHAYDPRLNRYPEIVKMPKGLTFYSKYVGTYARLDAGWSEGIGTATFTNTSGNTPVFDANGISIGTTRDDVLSYEISGNRTAAQETIVIKFTPDSNFANDGVTRTLCDTDTKRRVSRKQTTTTYIIAYPNWSDSVAVNRNTNNILANINYVFTMTCQSSGNPNDKAM